jgi:drug/metabolite transporter (DMT)-like permease
VKGSGSTLALTAALASAVLFGATTPIAKELLSGVSPLMVAGLLYVGSGVGVSLVWLAQDRGRTPIGLLRTDWMWLAGATLAGGLASLLLNLETVFTALLAWIAALGPGLISRPHRSSGRRSPSRSSDNPSRRYSGQRRR